MAFNKPPKKNKIHELDIDAVQNIGYKKNPRLSIAAPLGITSLLNLPPLLVKNYDNRSSSGSSINDGYAGQAYFRFISLLTATATITIIDFKGSTKILKCVTSGTNGAVVDGKVTFLVGANTYETAENFKDAAEDSTNGFWTGGFQTIKILANTTSSGSILMQQQSGTTEQSISHVSGNTVITYTNLSGKIENETSFQGGMDLEEDINDTNDSMYQLTKSIDSLNEISKMENILYQDTRILPFQASYYDSGGDRLRLATPIWYPPSPNGSTPASSYSDYSTGTLTHVTLEKNIGRDVGTSANGTKATAVFTFTDTPAVGACITLTDAVGLRKTYRCATDGTGVTASNACVTFDIGTGADAAAKAADVAINFKAAVEHANGHNGTIDCTLSTAQVTMEQDPADSMNFSNSNTQITVDATFETATSGTTVSAFSGGYTEVGNENFMKIGTSVHQLSCPRTWYRDTFIDRVHVYLQSSKSSSITADHQSVKYRFELYGGRVYATGTADWSSDHPGRDVENLEGATNKMNTTGALLATISEGMFYLGSSDWYTMTNSSNLYAQDIWFEVKKRLINTSTPFCLVMRFQDDADIDLLTVPTTSHIIIDSAVIGGPA